MTSSHCIWDSNHSSIQSKECAGILHLLDLQSLYVSKQGYGLKKKLRTSQRVVHLWRPLKYHTGQAACYTECHQKGTVHPYYPVICFSYLMGTPKIPITVVSRASYKYYQRQERWFDCELSEKAVYVYRYCTYPVQQTARIIWRIWQMKAWCLSLTRKMFSFRCDPCIMLWQLQAQGSSPGEAGSEVWAFLSGSLKALEEASWERKSPL